MQRQLEPELLDTLPAADPAAVRSRRDLQRVNALMNQVGILHQSLPAQPQAPPPRRIVELGAGDGTCLLGLAKKWSHPGAHADVVLVDQQRLVTRETVAAFAALGWRVEVVEADAFEWLARPSPKHAEVMIANLFLHHFKAEQLRHLFRLAAEQTQRFLASEPRRSPWALAAAHGLGLIGCNAVTRHDAVVSVRAGFSGPELSALWPDPQAWRLREGRAGLFSHVFFAERREALSPDHAAPKPFPTP